MEKEFNITGICRPTKHYMADVSNKLAQTLSMVEKGKYFIINRPRQYGKTTTLYTLASLLREKSDYRSEWIKIQDKKIFIVWV